MKIKISSMVFYIFFISIFFLGTSTVQANGIVINFSNSVPNKEIEIKGVFSDGNVIPNPGTLLPSPGRIVNSGATMGAAPDGRGLPEWVEFRWKEWFYPGEEYPKEFEARKIWKKNIQEMSRTLPIKSERIVVRNRVPVYVIEKLSRARLTPVEGEDLSLWLNFRWYPDGIRFYWKLKSGCCDLKEEGGDVID